MATGASRLNLKKVFFGTVLLGIFIVQNSILLFSLPAFVTQGNVEICLCDSFIQTMDDKYSKAVNVSMILSVISLISMLIWIYFSSIEKKRKAK